MPLGLHANMILLSTVRKLDGLRESYISDANIMDYPSSV